MSGTSADAIDAALVDFSQPLPQLLNSCSLPLPESLRKEIFALFTPGENEIDRMGALDRHLGHLFAEAALAVLSGTPYGPADITAIGSHGQTIRHRPRETGGSAFTVQIGDPNTIAQLTGITTVADFRRRDIASGGQGAPLAPAFHQAVFAKAGIARGVLNLGGIANITVLGADGHCSGFDTGPANGLMDYWIQRCRQQTYDRDGQWAASGQPSPLLLAVLQQHPFFALPPPKSTGKEEFTPAWLEACVAQFSASDADVQATLLEFTATTVAHAISNYCLPLEEVYLCGGGALNGQLRRRLAALLPGSQLRTTAELGVEVQWVEAMAFAWLAMRTLNGLSGNLPSVTGAGGLEVLGGIFRGK